MPAVCPFRYAPAAPAGQDDAVQKQVSRYSALKQKACNVVAAGGAAGFSAAVTTPLDCLKVRIQTAGGAPQTTLAVARALLREGALWRGLGPRIALYTPGGAIAWGGYEGYKLLLTSC